MEKECPPIKTIEDGTRMLRSWKETKSEILVQGLKGVSDDELENLLDEIMLITDGPMDFENTRAAKCEFIILRLKRAIMMKNTLSEPTRKLLTSVLLKLYDRGIGCHSEII